MLILESSKVVFEINNYSAIWQRATWKSANLIKTRMQKVSGEIIIVYGKRDI
jgi:hypothetical protein